MSRRIARAMTWAAILLVAFAGPALADDAIKERVDLGGICQGLRWGDTETWFVTRTADGPQYPNGAMVRVRVLDIANPPVATYEIALTDDTIRLPSHWTDRRADGTVTSFPDWWEYGYVLTGRVEGGTGTIVVTWGVTVDDGPPTIYPSELSIKVGAPCPGVQPTPAAPTTARTLDLTTILAVPRSGRFERFGPRPIRIRSVWSPLDLGLGGACDGSDSWLECGLEDWLIQPSRHWRGALLPLFFAPGVHDRLAREMRAGDGPLDVTGQFGDKASEDCRPENRDACRDQFVVTAMTRSPRPTPPATSTAAAIQPIDRPWDPIAGVIIAIAATMLLVWRFPGRATRSHRQVHHLPEAREPGD